MPSPFREGPSKAKIAMPRRIRKRRQISGGPVIGIGGAVSGTLGGSARGVIEAIVPQLAPASLAPQSNSLIRDAQRELQIGGILPRSAPRATSKPVSVAKPRSAPKAVSRAPARKAPDRRVSRY